jgi:hypothetical protein
MQSLNPQEECPECGAPLVEGMTCWEQLGGIIAWEFQDPELMAEHFLTVASYNFQHPASFTEEALAELRIAFIDYIDRGVPASELRRRAARAYDGKRRVLKDKAERQPILHRWKMTIAQVYTPNQLEGAAGRVKVWAASIRNEF